MKRFFISLLFIGVMSCSTKHPINYVSIRVQGDSVFHQYSLLAMTDSTMTLWPTSVRKYHEPEAITLPISKIERLYVQNSTDEGSDLGLGIGFGVGFLGTMVDVHRGVSWSEPLGLEQIGEVFFITSLTSIAGGITGCALADHMTEIDLGNPGSRDLLKKHCMTTAPSYN